MLRIVMIRVIVLVGMFIGSMDAVAPSYLTVSSPWIEETLHQMTLRDKIAQLFMIRVGLASTAQELATVSELITEYHVGGIFLVPMAKAGMAVTEEMRQSHCTIAHQVSLVNQLQKLSRLPLLVGADYEWGLAMRLSDGTQFPYAMALGATHDPALTRSVGATIGREARAVGVHCVAAPVLDVNTNPNNPVIGVRAFGAQPDIVAQYALQYMLGMQESGCIAIGKHFTGHQAGHGNTQQDSHYALPHGLDKSVTHPTTFQQAIDAGIGMIMSGHVDIRCLTAQERQAEEELPATMSTHIMTTLLQEKMHCAALVITDALDMGAIITKYGAVEANIRALQAGNHILLFANEIPATIDRIEQMVHDGLIAGSKIDAAVRKILQCKEWLGLPYERLVPAVTAASPLFADGKRVASRAYDASVIMPPQWQSFSTGSTLCCVSCTEGSVAACIEYLRDAGCVVREVSFQQWQQEYSDKKPDTQELVIFAIIIPARGTLSTDTQLLLQTIQQYLLNNSWLQERAVILVFGNPYASTILGGGNVVIGYDASLMAQQAVAKALLGETKPEARLALA